MRRRLACTLLLAFLCTLPATALAKKFRMAVSETESLVLDMPDEWIARSPNGAGGPIRTLSFASRTDRSFKLLVTVLPPAPDGRKMSLSDLRDILAKVADQAQQTSVETSLPPIDLIGPQVGGVYFIATDRAPLPGGYKHLTQGLLNAGEGLLNFTLLAHDDTPGGVTRLRIRAIAALRAATLEPRAAAR